MRFSFTLIAFLVSALLMTGCAVAQPVTETTGSEAAPTATAPTAAASADAHAGHGDVVVEEGTPFDAAFIDSMIEHHQGAIDMATLVLAGAEHDELRTLAEAILATQTSEIEQMQSWRSAWYPDLAPSAGMQMDMGEMEISDDTSIPFDRRFLEAMISHHQGAIHMAEMAQDQAEREEIRTLAAAIIAAQQTEIEQMQGWLDEWYSEN